MGVGPRADGGSGRRVALPGTRLRDPWPAGRSPGADGHRPLSARHHRPGAGEDDCRAAARGDLPRGGGDPDLSRLPYLQARYDHPKFIVRNLLRQWGGWWNGNAADLLPSTWEVQAREIVG